MRVASFRFTEKGRGPLPHPWNLRSYASKPTRVGAIFEAEFLQLQTPGSFNTGTFLFCSSRVRAALFYASEFSLSRCRHRCC